MNSAYGAMATVLVLTIGGIILICNITIAIQKYILNKDMWTTGLVVIVAELIIPITRIGGIASLIYTAFRWDKKKKQTNTPPEV